MSLFPAGIFAPVRRFFHRDPATMPDLTGRRALLSGLPLLLMRRAAPDPPPDAIGPLDWAEMELEVFGEKGGAR